MNGPAAHSQVKLRVLAILHNNAGQAFTTEELYWRVQGVTSKEALRGLLRRLAERGWVVHLPNHRWIVEKENSQIVREYIDAQQNNVLLVSQQLVLFCQLFGIPFKEVTGDPHTFVLHDKVRVRLVGDNDFDIDRAGGTPIMLPDKVVRRLVKDWIFGKLFAAYVKALSNLRNEEATESSTSAEAIPT